MPRPLSVTIVSVLVIVYGLYTLAAKIYLVSSPGSADLPKVAAFRNWLLAEAAEQDARQRARR